MGNVAAKAQNHPLGFRGFGYGMVNAGNNGSARYRQIPPPGRIIGTDAFPDVQVEQAKEVSQLGRFTFCRYRSGSRRERGEVC
jgi:hypothetical protein